MQFKGLLIEMSSVKQVTNAPINRLLQTNLMIKREEIIAMRAIALCFNPFLKPEEACIYTNLGRTQFVKKYEAFGVYKNNNGYYKREDIDKMLAGEATLLKISVKITIKKT